MDPVLKFYLELGRQALDAPDIEYVETLVSEPCATCHKPNLAEHSQQAYEAGVALGEWLSAKTHGRFFDGVHAGMRGD